MTSPILNAHYRVLRSSYKDATIFTDMKVESDYRKHAREGRTGLAHEGVFCQGAATVRG
jgi:hypothetical protein